MESELKPLVAASVTPVWAISCARAEQQPVPPKPRTTSAAEMESELKPLAAASVTPVWAISRVRAEQQPVLPKPRTKAAAEMESELELLVAASVTPVWANSLVCAEQQPVLPKPRTKAAAEMESELKPLATASCPAGRSAACAEQAAHSERERSGRDVKLAEAAGGGKRYARLGDQLCTRRAAACAAQAENESSG